MTISEQPQIKDPNKPLEIRIFSLNIWGIPNISKDRQQRVQAIAQQLASAHDPYHYVFLQEVWSRSDFRFIADKVSKILPHSHYFYSGVIGSGVCVLSCSPLHEAHYHPFSLNGYPSKIHHGDWFGGKGLAMCKTTFQGIPILLVNTHLHAEYDDENDQYVHHRVSQAFEVSQLLRFTLKSHHLALCAGDLNSTTNEIPYRLLTYNTGLVDSFLDCPIKPADGVGATNETPSNSYTSLKALKANPNGSRIDYIFYWASEQYQVKTLVHDQPLPHRVPQTDFSFSDHEGIRSVLSIKFKPANQETEECPDSNTICFNRTDSLLDASAVCTHGLRTVTKGQKFYSWTAVCLCIVQMVILGVLFMDMRGTARFFLTLFLMCITLLFAFCVYMTTIFCNQEYNAIMGVKQGLEKLLEEVRQKNAKYFEEQKKKASKQ